MVELASDFIAVRKLEIKQKSKIEVISVGSREASTVLNPENYDEHPFQGVVVSAGSGFILPEGKRKRMNCKAGDRVLYRPSITGKYEWVVIEGEVLMLMRDSDVIGIIK